MKDALVILGRQPALGLAELESLYGKTAVRPVGNVAAQIKAEVDFSRLGGSIKLGEVLASLDSAEWRAIESFLLKALVENVGQHDGKLRLGVSAYGFSVKPAQVEALGLSLKKALKKTGQSVRLVPNKTTDLSSAQTFHNRLAEHNGLELLLVRDGERTVIARVTAVQDINAYTLRDRGRPKRDSRVGMLPPKLAQIIVNLAVARDAERGRRKAEKNVADSSFLVRRSSFTLLDPFCGTGVVLQEALLMGYDAYGSDLESRMIDYSGENLDWLDTNFTLPTASLRLEQGDATSHHWDPAPDFVACEAYLGKPFTARPIPEVLAQTVSECDLIIKKFLKNIHAQLAPATRFCVAVPAWQTSPGIFKHLPLIDRISDLGYNRVKFEHVRDDQLLYYREDQVVGRQLLVLTRI